MLKLSTHELSYA